MTNRVHLAPMEKRRLMCYVAMLLTALLGVYLWARPCTAFAYGVEQYFDKLEDVPASIRDALPADKTFAYGEGSFEAVAISLESNNGGVEAWIFQSDDGAESYRFVTKSTEFPTMEGQRAHIGFTGTDLFVTYSDDLRTIWFGSFTEDYLGRWLLTGVNNEGGLTSFWAYYRAEELIDEQHGNQV